MQQTKEHLMIINILGIKNVIIVQTKVDIVGKEAAITHQKQIREFIKGSVIEDAPIVPVMPNMGINLDIIFKMIVEMQRPERDNAADPLMYIVRSFDINKPGVDLKTIKGGVAGGSLIRGTLKVGDRIEISPGIKVTKSKKEVYAPIVTVVKSLSNGTDPIDVATPGGLVGISTEIDPAFAKADGLVGNIVGHVGKTPKATTTITVKYHKLERDDIPSQHIADNETMILGIGTATVLGYIKRAKKDTVEFELKRPVCIDRDMKIAVMRNIAKRWKLTGYGTLA
jgi:translation initiation factor 2 subunit 3